MEASATVLCPVRLQAGQPRLEYQMPSALSWTASGLSFVLACSVLAAISSSRADASTCVRGLWGAAQVSPSRPSSSSGPGPWSCLKILSKKDLGLADGKTHAVGRGWGGGSGALKVAEVVVALFGGDLATVTDLPDEPGIFILDLVMSIATPGQQLRMSRFWNHAFFSQLRNGTVPCRRCCDAKQQLHDFRSAWEKLGVSLLLKMMLIILH